jgi:hypothetical protein
MKLNKETLKQIIREELDAVMNEDAYDDDASGDMSYASPVWQLNDNPDMPVQELVELFLSKDYLNDPHLGGFDDYDTNMYDLRSYANAYPEDPRAKKIAAALQIIKTQRNQ